MHKSFLSAGILITALVGLADSWYLFQSEVTGTALTCDLGAALNGCNIVASSQYSQLFGIPIALYGVFFYGLVFVLALAVSFVHLRLWYRILFLLTLAGLAASVVFVAIQFFLIKALCVYCLVSALASVVVFVFAQQLLKHFIKPSSETVITTISS